jgi:plastocyanin
VRAVESTFLVLVAMTLACAGGTPPVISPEPVPSGPNEVVIFNYTYKPLTLTVPVGTTVVWVNKDLAPHTVTHRAYGRDNFDSGNLLNAQKFTKTFRRPGTFDYICSLHQGMQGTLVVKDTVTAKDSIPH